MNIIKSTYEERICVFLDFLGFQNIVAETLTNPNYLVKTINALSMSNEHFKQDEIDTYFGVCESKVVTQFSDSIVLSFNVNEESEIYYTLSDIKNLIGRLILRGYVVRGGISVGQLIHSNTILIGPAMIDAYKLEHDMAKNPRIIIDPKVLEKAKEYHGKHHNSEWEMKFIETNITKDDDEYYYIDYFGKIIDVLDDPEYDIFNYLSALKKIIIDGLKLPVCTSKYEWMKTKYNKMVTDNFNEYLII